MRRVGLAFSFLALVACGGDDGGSTADRLVINVIDAAALPDMGPPADASLFNSLNGTGTDNPKDSGLFAAELTAHFPE